MRELEPKYYKNVDETWKTCRPGFVSETWDRKEGLHQTMLNAEAPLTFRADLTVGQVRVIDNKIYKKQK